MTDSAGPLRILVGCAHSAESQHGLAHASALAASTGARLTVVHVAVPIVQLYGSLGAMTPIDDPERRGEALLRRAVDGLPQDVGVDWRLVAGADARTRIGRRASTWAALLSLFVDGHHDLLVVGTGREPGRIARALERHCPGRVVSVAGAVPGQPPRQVSTVVRRHCSR